MSSNFERRGGGSDQQAPAGGMIELLERKYAMRVLGVVGTDGAQFGDVETALPAASAATLSDRLTELVAAGLLAREEYDEIPPRVEYELTPDGRSLHERLVPVFEWVADDEADRGRG